MTLRERVASLERKLNDAEERFRALVTGIEVGVVIQGPASEILFANDAARAMLARPAAHQVEGVTSRDPSWDAIHEDGTPFPAEERPIATVLASKRPARDVVIGLAKPGQKERAWILVNAVPQFDAEGALTQVVATFADISKLKATQEQLRLQAETILALSTPLIPIAEGVVVLPILGALDRQRIERLLETLLQGVVKHRTRVAILDLTGVLSPDAESVMGLMRVAQAARLLGARVVVTGVRPEVARTLVDLDQDLRGVTVISTLKQAVAQVLGERGGR